LSRCDRGCPPASTHPFESQFARLGEYDRAFLDKRLVEQDSVAAPLGDEPHEGVPPLLQRALAQIVAAETQKVEGHECGLLPAVLGQQRMEVAPSVVQEYDRFAVGRRGS
jgi:hypothetical protein